MVGGSHVPTSSVSDVVPPCLARPPERRSPPRQVLNTPRKRAGSEIGAPPLPPNRGAVSRCARCDPPANKFLCTFAPLRETFHRASALSPRPRRQRQDVPMSRRDPCRPARRARRPAAGFACAQAGHVPTRTPVARRPGNFRLHAAANSFLRPAGKIHL